MPAFGVEPCSSDQTLRPIELALKFDKSRCVAASVCLCLDDFGYFDIIDTIGAIRERKVAIPSSARGSSELNQKRSSVR